MTCKNSCQLCDLNSVPIDSTCDHFMKDKLEIGDIYFGGMKLFSTDCVTCGEKCAKHCVSSYNISNAPSVSYTEYNSSSGNGVVKLNRRDVRKTMTIQGRLSACNDCDLRQYMDFIKQKLLGCGSSELIIAPCKECIPPEEVSLASIATVSTNSEGNGNIDAVLTGGGNWTTSGLNDEDIYITYDFGKPVTVKEIGMLYLGQRRSNDVCILGSDTGSSWQVLGSGSELAQASETIEVNCCDCFRFYRLLFKKGSGSPQGGTNALGIRNAIPHGYDCCYVCDDKPKVACATLSNPDSMFGDITYGSGGFVDFSYSFDISDPPYCCDMCLNVEEIEIDEIGQGVVEICPCSDVPSNPIISIESENGIDYCGFFTITNPSGNTVDTNDVDMSDGGVFIIDENSSASINGEPIGLKGGIEGASKCTGCSEYSVCWNRSINFCMNFKKNNSIVNISGVNQNPSGVRLNSVAPASTCSLGGEVYTVDWGDGTIEPYVFPYLHDYPFTPIGSTTQYNGSVTVDSNCGTIVIPFCVEVIGVNNGSDDYYDVIMTSGCDIETSTLGDFISGDGWSATLPLPDSADFFGSGTDVEPILVVEACGSFTDLTWDWGDGTIDQQGMSPSHTYPTPALNASDSYNGSVSFISACGDFLTIPFSVILSTVLSATNPAVQYVFRADTAQVCVESSCKGFIQPEGQCQDVDVPLSNATANSLTNDASDAIDGNPTGSWYSNAPNFSLNQNDIIWQAEPSGQFDTIKINWDINVPARRSSNLDIECSTNGTTWTPLITGYDASADLQSIIQVPVSTCPFIRVIFKAGSGEQVGQNNAHTIRMGEFELCYCEPIIINATPNDFTATIRWRQCYR